MFKIFSILVFLFYFSAFGEKAPEATGKAASKVKVSSKAVSKAVSKKTVSPEEAGKTVSKGTASPKAVNKAVSKETASPKGEVKASTSSVKSDPIPNPSPSPALQGDSAIKPGESSLTGSFTYNEALDRYREVAHLEWLGGMGYMIDSLALFVPVVLELHIPIIPIDPKLTGLLQAGGMFVYVSAPIDYYQMHRAAGITTVFQAGLKYSFSNQVYGSFKAGPLGLFIKPFPPNVWTGGLFFGFGSDSLTMEVGLQSLYNVNNSTWDVGFVVNIGSVLKKWWSAKH